MTAAVTESTPANNMTQTESKVDLAMMAVLKTPIEDAVIFKWARQQLGNHSDKAQRFQLMYLKRKKSKAVAQLLNLIAFAGLGGLQRFYLGDIGLGIAHLLTVGFFWIGTIIDMIALNQRVNKANVNIAMQTLELVRAMG